MHDRVFGPNLIFTRNKTPVLYQGTIRNKCSPRTCSAPHPVAAIYHAESLFAKPLFLPQNVICGRKRYSQIVKSTSQTIWLSLIHI